MQSQFPDTSNTGGSPGLKLLITLRWLALAGQIGLCLFSRFYLEMLLPWEVLIPCMALTALTNAAAFTLRNRKASSESTLCTTLLVLDTLTLTIMLFWTGGAHNPFATFYLLHIAIATILLSYKMAWAMVILSGICYSLLFASHHTLTSLSAHEFCGSLDFHVQGMLFSMVLVGMGIVFFAGRLKAELARKDAQLQQAQDTAVRNERFASLATLAAGVAHELSTPLGTIAIVSEELEEQAGTGCMSKACLSDARLIRSEVQRCRDVIEKLREQTTDGIGDPVQDLPIDNIPQRLAAYLKPDHLQRICFTNHCKRELVRAPQTALLQSLAVLIKNACQSGNDEQPVNLSVEEATGALRFRVEDKGKGMSSETIIRLGEPFFTTKEPGQGMGLGLFLVRMFIERIHGTLDVQSSAATGTTIELSIPQHEDAPR